MNDKAIGGIHWSFWAIGAATLIYNLAGVMNFFAQMNASSVAAMPEAYRSLIEGRPVWATGAFALAVFGGAFGCIFLLLKQKVASYLFVISLAGAIVTMIHALGMTGSDIGPVSSLVGNLVQLLVTVLLIWYSKRVESKGWIG